MESLANKGKVNILAKHEYKEAALTLAQAFEKDLVARYFVDTPSREHWSEEEKWRLHVAIIEYITYAHILKGVVTAFDDGGNDNDGKYASVALWMPPGADIDTPTIFRSGLWRLYYKLCREGRMRFFDEFFPLLHDTKAAVLAERDHDSYYLVYIGTRPKMQGNGYARKVIEHMGTKADGDGKAMYLESSNVVNERFYRSMGFEAKKEIAMTRMGEGRHVKLNIMVREPKNGCAENGKTKAAEAEESSDKMKHSTRFVPKVELRASAGARNGDAKSKPDGRTVKAYAVVRTDETNGVMIA